MPIFKRSESHTYGKPYGISHECPMGDIHWDILFPRTGYFIPGRDGTGAWQISGVIRVAARACFVYLRENVDSADALALVAKQNDSARRFIALWELF